MRLKQAYRVIQFEHEERQLAIEVAQRLMHDLDRCRHPRWDDRRAPDRFADEQALVAAEVAVATK